MLVVALCALAAGTAPAKLHAQASAKVAVVNREADRRVDVTVGDKPFTSYIYPTTLKKPVLYPILSANGTPVTRGYPLEPRPGERVDHPHHAGLWFNYGDVNGLDFWNNSDAIRITDGPKMGTIVHRAVKGTKSGAGMGSLDVTTEWVDEAMLDSSPGLVRTLSVQPPRGTGRLRLVRIGPSSSDDPVDLQPCGGTHVANTSEVGVVRVLKIENKGRQNRRIALALGE